MKDRNSLVDAITSALLDRAFTPHNPSIVYNNTNRVFYYGSSLNMTADDVVVLSCDDLIPFFDEDVAASANYLADITLSEMGNDEQD